MKNKDHYKIRLISGLLGLVVVGILMSMGKPQFAHMPQHLEHLGPVVAFELIENAQNVDQILEVETLGPKERKVSGHLKEFLVRNTLWDFLLILFYTFLLYQMAYYIIPGWQTISKKIARFLFGAIAVMDVLENICALVILAKVQNCEMSDWWPALMYKFSFSKWILLPVGAGFLAYFSWMLQPRFRRVVLWTLSLSTAFVLVAGLCNRLNCQQFIGWALSGMILLSVAIILIVFLRVAHDCIRKGT